MIEFFPTFSIDVFFLDSTFAQLPQTITAFARANIFVISAHFDDDSSVKYIIICSNTRALVIDCQDPNILDVLQAIINPLLTKDIYGVNIDSNLLQGTFYLPVMTKDYASKPDFVSKRQSFLSMLTSHQIYSKYFEIHDFTTSQLGYIVRLLLYPLISLYVTLKAVPKPESLAVPTKKAVPRPMVVRTPLQQKPKPPQIVLPDVSKYSFDVKDFEMVQSLGSGATGDVKLYRKIATSEFFAIKEFHTTSSNSQALLHFEREVINLIKLKHPTIERVFGYRPASVMNNTEPMILLEFLAGGTLRQMLDLEREGRAPAQWTPTKKSCCLYGIAAGIKCMHLNNIMHRDLKASNIMLDSHLNIRIADFDLSKQVESSNVHTLEIGTVAYSSPEEIQGKSYDFSSDIYSFAMIVYEMVELKRPYEDEATMIDVIKAIAAGNQPVMSQQNAITELYQECVNVTSTRRTNSLLLTDVIKALNAVFPKTDTYQYQMYVDRIDSAIIESPSTEIHIITLRQNAEAGDQGAQFTLGALLMMGIGTNIDVKQSAHFFELAAKQGHIDAMFNLALFCGKSASPADAVDYYLPSAHAGVSDSMCNYARMLAIGDSVAMDIKSAIKWYQMAAEDNDLAASFNLARYYLDPEQDEYNPRYAAKILERQAHLGHQQSMILFARLLRFGRGVKRDPTRAGEYEKLAADLGAGDSMADFAITLFHGVDTAADQSEAVRWAFKSSELQYQPGINILEYFKAQEFCF